jgi:ubiquinone biosynthesis protein UbiJ
VGRRVRSGVDCTVALDDQGVSWIGGVEAEALVTFAAKIELSGCAYRGEALVALLATLEATIGEDPLLERIAGHVVMGRVGHGIEAVRHLVIDRVRLVRVRTPAVRAAVSYREADFSGVEEVAAFLTLIHACYKRG